MSNNVLYLGISIPINYMIGSYPVMVLYSGPSQIWPAKSPIAFVKAEGNWAQDLNAFTSNKISASRSTIEKVYFKNLGGKTITISYDVDSEKNYDYLTIFALDSETEVLATSKANGTANGSYGKVGSVDFTFPDDGKHFICFKYSKDGSGDSGRDNAIVTFPLELFGEVKWVLVGEVMRYEYENESNTLYKCIYQDLQASVGGVLIDTHKDGTLISKEVMPADIISPNDKIKLNNTPYETAVPEVNPDTVYRLSFNSPTLIIFGNPIKISSWGITTRNKLTEIRGLNLVDTSNMTNMTSMFNNCSSLTSLDVSNFNTSSVTYMNSMFSGCSGLTSLDVSNFNTSSVIDMNFMFRDCSKLTSLDVSSWDTSKVTNMNSIFGYCSGLTSLDVSNFNTSNVTNMSSMFNNCSKLTSLDVSNFNTSKVTTMGWMFQSCSKLTSLDVSSWDTSKVTNMYTMFNSCSKLTSLDLSNFNTSKVTNMGYMFQGCSKLTSLDLSNFNTSSVTNMGTMFQQCSNLTSLNLSGWNLSKVTGMGSMFYNCSKLTMITGPITGISTNIDLKHSPLTHDSAMVFLNGLNTVTGTKTITFKSTTYKTLTKAEIAAATAKGWTVKSAA